VVPVLSHLNPEAEKHWSKFAGHSALATEYLDSVAKPLLTQAQGHLGSLNISTLKAANPYLRQWALAIWLDEQKLLVESSFLEGLDTLLDAPGKKMTLGGQVILNEAGHLWAPAVTPSDGQKLAIGESLEVHVLGGYLQTRLGQRKKELFSELKSTGQVAFDAERLHLGLKVRPWQAGDRFKPFGLQGSVKIGDLFTNLKIPNPLREHWPLVVCGEEIIWVVGLRRGAIAPMSRATTHVLYMEYVGTLVSPGN
jgi:tRNA(Ile)-lysidine synthase